MKNNLLRHQQYMQLALVEAEKALQRGDFPVGCVLADEEGLICTGSREKSSMKNELEHAEIVALRRLYQDHPDRLEGKVVVYSTMEPCLMCFSTLLVNNIRTIVYGYEDAMGGGTGLNLNDLNPLYRSMVIEVIPDILRDQCLKLFKLFFKNSDNTYLKDTLLATYTLSQKS